MAGETIEAQINRIKANIANSYAKAAAKGAELPSVQNSENLAATIETIPTGGLPDDVYTITLEADPPEGGTVSGGGIISEGMTATVTVSAEAKKGYKFTDWQEKGETISDSKK